MSRGGKTYGTKYLNVLYHGSPSGHSNSRGGGIIELIATETVINYGVIDCSGKKNYGGSGGSIKIQCKTFQNFGLIVSTGADSLIEDDSLRDTLTGNGGFGRIAIYCSQYLNEGTIYPIPYIQRVSNIDLKNIDFSKIAINKEEKESKNDDHELIDVNKYFYSVDVNQDTFFHFFNYSKYLYQYNIESNLIITSALKVPKYNWYPNFGGVLQIHSPGTISIESNGTVNANGMGHHHRERTFISYYYEAVGVGQHEDDFYGGGSYGSLGGNFEKAECGKIYGTKALDALFLGCPSGYLPSRGGGIIELIAETVINKGSMYCDGNIYGGSGGSIKIICRNFINYGIMTAKGGTNPMDKDGRKCIGFGGDGRIAIHCEKYLNHVEDGAVIDPEPFIKNIKYVPTLSFTPIAYNDSDIDLMEACERDRHQIIYQLLSKMDDVDINQKKEDEDDEEIDGATPLFITAKHGLTLSLQHLLCRKDIKVDEPNNEGKTPWMIAIEEDHTEVIQMLLNYSQQSKLENQINGVLDVNQTSSDGKSALHFAVKNKSLKLVDMLLQCKDIDINQMNKDGKTALMMIIKDHNDHIRDINRRNRDKDNDSDAKDEEEIEYDLQIFHLLINHSDIDLNATNKDGKTALGFAVEDGNKEIVEMLLKCSEIQLNIKDSKGDTVFTATVERGDVEMAKMILNTDDKSLILQHSNKDGKNALMHAVEHGRKEMAQFLLDQNQINIHKVDKEGDTAVTIAIKKKHSQILRCLLNTITERELESKEDIELLLQNAHEFSWGDNYYINRAFAEYWFYNANDYKKAIAMYNTTIEICIQKEHHWRNHLNLAFCYYKTDDIDTAIKESLNALSFDNKNGFILGHLSFYYVLQQKYETAEPYTRTALQIDPNERVSTAVMANIKFESERYMYPLESKKYFKQSLNLEINSKHTRWVDHDTRYTFKEYDEMVYISLKNLYQHYLDGNNSDYALNEMYADYCYEHKKYSDAKDSIQEAIKECKSSRKQHRNHCHLYKCYQEIGSLKEAIQYALIAKDYKSYDEEILSDLGLFYFQTKQYPEAIQYLIKANENIIFAKKRKYENHYYLAKCYFQTKDIDGAIKSMTIAVSRWSKDRNMLQDLGYFHFLKENYKEAAEYFEKALEYQKNSRIRLQIYNRLLSCYQKTDNIDDAIKYALLLLEDDEEDADILRNLGTLYFKKKNYNESIKYLKSANKHCWDKEQCCIHDILLSKCYHKIGNMDEAIGSALSAYAYAPDNKEVLCVMALCYFSKKEYVLSVRYSRFVVDIDPKSHCANAVLALSLYEMKKYDESIQYFKNTMCLALMNQDIGRLCFKTFLEFLIQIEDIENAKKLQQNLQNIIETLKDLKKKEISSSNRNVADLKSLIDDMEQTLQFKLVDFDIDLNSEKLKNLMTDSDSK